MVLAVILGSGLAFFLDAFFITSLNLPIKISFSLLGLVLFLMAGHRRSALALALLTGLLFDVSSSFSFFGVNLAWHFVIYLLASWFLTSFLGAGKKSSVVIFSFLASFVYYAGQDVILFLRNYLISLDFEFKLLSALMAALESSVVFCLMVIAAQALWRWWRGLWRGWFLTR